MSAVAVGLFGLVLLKCTAVVNAVKWASGAGNAYGVAYRQARPATEADRIALIEKHGGQFFPFGGKDYLLRRTYAHHPGDGLLRVLARKLLRFFSSNLFNARRLSIISMTFLFAAGTFVQDLSTTARTACIFLAMALPVLNLLLILEAVSWYATVRAYARPFFTLGFNTPWPSQDSSALDELRVVGRLAMFGTATGAICVSTLQSTVDAFRGISEEVGLAGQLKRLADAAYYAIAELTQSGHEGLAPASSIGRVATGILVVQGILLITLALSLVVNLLGSKEPS